MQDRKNIRCYYPSGWGILLSIATIPLIILAAWPFADAFGDERHVLIGLFALPIFCLMAFGLTAHGYRFEFHADAPCVTVRHCILLYPIGDGIQIPYDTITDLIWSDKGGEGGAEVIMTVAGLSKYTVTSSRSKAKQIAQLVLEAQPNLRPNLHRALLD